MIPAKISQITAGIHAGKPGLPPPRLRIIMNGVLFLFIGKTPFDLSLRRFYEAKNLFLTLFKDILYKKVTPYYFFPYFCSR